MILVPSTISHYCVTQLYALEPLNISFNTWHTELNNIPDGFWPIWTIVVWFLPWTYSLSFSSFVVELHHFVRAVNLLGALHTTNSCQPMLNKHKNSSCHLLSASCAHKPGTVLIIVPSVPYQILPSALRLSEEKQFAQSAGTWTQQTVDAKAHIRFNALSYFPSWTCTADFFHLNSRHISC